MAATQGNADPDSNAVNGSPEVPPEGVQPIEAPSFYVSGLQASLTGNDAAIVLMQHQPSTTAGIGLLTPVAILHMSLPTLKDFAVLTSHLIERCEKREDRIIETEYTRKLATEAAVQQQPKPRARRKT